MRMFDLTDGYLSRNVPPSCQLLICVCLLMVTATAAPRTVHGDSPQAEAVSSPGSSVKDIQAKQEKVKQRIARLHAASETAEGAAPLPQVVKEELDTLSWLDLTYSQLLALRETAQSTRRELAEVQQEWESLAKFGIGQPAPYSYTLLDDIRAERLKLQSRLQSLNSLESTTDHALQKAKSELKEAEGRRRQSKEALTNEQQLNQRATRQIEHERALLACEAKQAALEQQRAESLIRQLQIQAIDQKINVLNEKQRIVSSSVQFSAAELESRMKMLDETEKELRDDMSEKLRELVRWQLPTSSSHQPPDADRANADPLRQLRSELRQQEVNLTRQMLRELVEVCAAWRWRYQLANESVSLQQLHEWLEIVQNAQVRINSLSETLNAKLDELRDKSFGLRKIILRNADTQEDAKLRNTRIQIEELERASAFLNKYVTLTRAGTRLLQLTLDDVNLKLSPSSRASMLDSMTYWSQEIWNYELAAVDDRSITIGKILSALGLLLGGLLLARLVSQILARGSCRGWVSIGPGLSRYRRSCSTF